VTPQKKSNYLAHISAVFSVTGTDWNYPLDENAMRDALIVAKKFGQTRKSRNRNRRPTLHELDRLMTHFHERATRHSCVMRHSHRKLRTKLIALGQEMIDRGQAKWAVPDDHPEFMRRWLWLK
jgi:hypothetical protein